MRMIRGKVRSLRGDDVCLIFVYLELSNRRIEASAEYFAWNTRLMDYISVNTNSNNQRSILEKW